MLGCEVTSLERELFSLPARMGGLGISKPNEMSEMLFNSSKESTKVIDTDAQFYVNRSPMDVLGVAEKEKKTKYSIACEERRGTFTPFCCSVDGLLGHEAETFLRRIGDCLAVKWERSYSEVMGWIRARLVFTVL